MWHHIANCLGSPSEPVCCSTIAARLEARAREGSHFMPPTLLASQLATLELGDDVVCVPVAPADDEDTAAALALQVLEQHAAAVG